MGFLHGKRVLVVGIASQRSIAWGIANAMHREGAQLAFTYQNERLKDRVEEAANTFGSNIVLPCDVAEDAQIDGLFADLAKHWTDGFDILVHSVGFAPRETMRYARERAQWRPGAVVVAAALDGRLAPRGSPGLVRD